MKKLMAFAAAISLAFPIGVAIPSTAAASAGGDSAVVTACQQTLDALYGISQGNCVAYFGNGNLTANGLCHSLQSLDPTDFNLLYSSFGACVSATNVALGKS